MNNIDRNANYKQHRLRIQNATSLVNSQAPKPKPTSEELRNYTFLEMLTALTGNNKQTANAKSPVRIQDIKKYCQSDRDHSKDDNWKEFPIPFHIRQRYEHFSFTRDWNLMQKLLRPTIFLDLVNNKAESLGRLVVQLFTEACPEVVLQFVSTCLAKKHDRFNITRLLVPLWLEAALLFDNKNAFTASNIAHDPMAVKHDSAAGILSFPSRYLHGSKLRFITFTISFTPLNVLNGKRIAFGVIKRGQKVLERLQSFEVTHSGKPCKNIVVSACGICN